MKKQTHGFLGELELAEFEVLLAEYQPSSEAVHIFADSNSAVIAGPAGAGKDTLRNRLIRLYPDSYQPILSTTTRPIRPKERDGVDYHFVSKETMKRGIEEGKFLQAELVHSQQISAMSIEEFQDLGDDKIGLSILVVKTERELHEYKLDMKTVFLIPPSLDEMVDRLKRSSRSSARDEVVRRLKAARDEIVFASTQNDYYCLVTNNPDQTAALVDSYLVDGIRDDNLDQIARQRMQEILCKL